MAGYKETPRQKMIGMMYLVLTALLALNVSVEILNAFLVVNTSIETTNKSFARKIDQTLSEFSKQFAINPNKVGTYWEKAKLARKYTDDMVRYINSTKLECVMKSEGIDSAETIKRYYKVDYRPDPAGKKDSIPFVTLQLGTVPTKDKFDETTHYFIGDSQDGSKGKSREMKERLAAYKKNMLSLVDPRAKDNFKIGIDLDGPFFDADGSKQNWEMHNFYHTILAADVTILNKLINEAQSTEFDVVNHLFAAISAEDFKFDAITGRVVPQTRYVFQGEDYTAEVFVAAYDTKSAPEVRILEGADTITDANIANAKPIEGVNGLVRLKLPGSSEGLKKYAGVIMVKTPLGITKKYYFHDEYIVAKPSLIVSPTKMNVFYIGVPNPVSISVPGIAAEKIKPSISSGSISKDPAGKDWIVTVPKESIGKKTNISVSVTDGNKSKNMGGGVEFRVKRVPDPNPSVGGRPGGFVSREELIALGVVEAKMPQEFDFDFKYDVTSFDFVSIKSGDIFKRTVSGARFSEEVKNFISKQTKRGQKIWIENIVAKGMDGSTRKLSTVSLEIK